MFELVIVACLLKQPSYCEEFRVPFQAEMTMMQCTFSSIIHAAKWTEQHPGWRIRRTTCSMPRA